MKDFWLVKTSASKPIMMVVNVSGWGQNSPKYCVGNLAHLPTSKEGYEEFLASSMRTPS